MLVLCIIARGYGMTEVKIKLWVLLGCIGLLIPIVGYIINFAVTRIINSIDKLDLSLINIGNRLNSLQVWSQNRFISRDEHKDALEAIKEYVTLKTSRLEREFDKVIERKT
jgi:hypothetical protein